MNILRLKRAAFLCAFAACWTIGSLTPRAKRVAGRVIRLRGDIDWAPGKAPADDTMPPYHVYFGGRHVKSDGNGMYQLSVTEEEQESMLSDLSLIICKRFVPQFERAQTVAGMKIQKEHKCKWYDLIREYDEVAQQNYWTWELRTGNDAPKAGDLLPDNAIVVSMSSDRVVGLKQVRFPKQITGQIVLPQILIETGEKSMRASVKSDIESITSRNMNADQTPRTSDKAGVTLSAPVA